MITFGCLNQREEEEGEEAPIMQIKIEVSPAHETTLPQPMSSGDEHVGEIPVEVKAEPNIEDPSQEDIMSSSKEESPQEICQPLFPRKIMQKAQTHIPLQKNIKHMEFRWNITRGQTIYFTALWPTLVTSEDTNILGHDDTQQQTIQLVYQ